MICVVCSVPVTERPLYRTAPKGVSPANWCCEQCLDKPLDERIDVVDLIEAASHD